MTLDKRDKVDRLQMFVFLLETGHGEAVRRMVRDLSFQNSITLFDLAKYFECH